MPPDTWTPPPQDPPRPNRTPLYVALAVAITLPAIGGTAWYLTRDDTQAPAAAPSPSNTRTWKQTAIKFEPSASEAAFLKQVKDTRQNVGWEGNDLGLLNHGRAICGLGERESDGTTKTPATQPPTADALLTDPPDGAEKSALLLLCPKYQLTFLKAELGFREGTWKVGAKQGPETVTPGQYRTTTARDGCAWTRVRDGKVVKVGSGSGKVTARIVKGDDGFESKGCGNWAFIHK